MQERKVFSVVFRVVRSAPCLAVVFWACMGVGSFLAMGSALAAQIAMVTDVQGEGTLHRAGAALPLDILMNLTGGEDMSLETGTRVTVVYLGSGEEFEATGPGRLTVDAARLQSRSGVQVVRRVSPLAGATGPFAAAGGVIQGAVRMRSLSTPSVRLVGPQGKQLQPPTTFTWVTAAQADVTTAYAFELREAGGAGPALLSLETQAQQVTLPQGTPLIAERAYRWSLSFVDASGRRNNLDGTFEISSSAESGRWLGLRPPPNAPLSDWVVYAGLLKEANFLADARAIWSDLAQRRPASAELDALSRR